MNQLGLFAPLGTNLLKIKVETLNYQILKVQILGLPLFPNSKYKDSKGKAMSTNHLAKNKLDNEFWDLIVV